MTADVLSSPALSLLLALEARGATFILDGDDICIRPTGLLTPHERQLLQAHYQEARLLVVLSTDAALQSRRERFRVQLADAAPGTMPVLRFRAGVPYVQGVCFSCGVPLDELVFGRCWRCALAWRLACGISISASWYDTAQICT
jgi:hypothetical protein